jgi:hydroxymethylglutaryl-CoA synthase
VTGVRTLPGISDIAFYLPKLSVDLTTIVTARMAEDAAIGEQFLRAKESTGQKSMRIPEPWEDSATMAAEAARALLDANPGAAQSVRYLMVGTESGLDHSKPLAAWVQGMLERAGTDLASNLLTAQVQHACAGASVALLAIAAQLALGGRMEENGLVICSDIARYARATTAELTQGAGALALLVQPEARLVGIDLASCGFASHDVDDFFRPLGSATPFVKGHYSIRCYREALEEAFLDHAARLSVTPREVLEGTDIFVLHAPYYRLPVDALRWLVARQLSYDNAKSTAFIQERGFEDSVSAVSLVGNLFTGSIYLALIRALKGAHERFGKGIAGKRILFASYGSGNTMAVFSGVIAEGAYDIISRWKARTDDSQTEAASLESYDAWMRQEGVSVPLDRLADLPADKHPRAGAFYLKNIREDGYREYGIKG